MYAIRLPSGDFLDLPPGTELGFELQNAVFLSGDNSALPGSYSFPADLPATGRNRRLLGFPEHIHRAEPLRAISGVWIFADGLPVTSGSLTVKSAEPDKFSIYIVGTPTTTMKEKFLRELSLDLITGVSASAASWQSRMYNTCNTPEDYSYIMPPVWLKDGSTRRMYNQFDDTTTAFSVGTNDTFGIIPFVAVRHILEKIFADLGVAFENNWQMETEMKRLYVTNNVDLMNTSGTSLVFPTSEKLTDHVPEIKVPEFLRGICAVFGLGIFWNFFTNSARLSPLQSVLQAPTKWDWTRWAAGTMKIEHTPGIRYFNYKKHPTEPLPAKTPQPEDVPAYNTFTEAQAAIGSFADGDFIYVENRSSVFKRIQQSGSPVWSLVATRFRGEKFSDGDEEFLADVRIWQNVKDPTTPYYPYLESEPSGKVWTGAAFEDSEDVHPFGLLLFRRFQSVPTYGTVPVSANHVWAEAGSNARYSISASEDAEHSLNFFGEYGLYAKQWGVWHEMLRNGKHITQSFTLPIRLLTEFSFEHKVRVGSMDFFVKKLRVGKLLGGGSVLVEASMVSVI